MSCVEVGKFRSVVDFTSSAKNLLGLIDLYERLGNCAVRVHDFHISEVKFHLSLNAAFDVVSSGLDSIKNFLLKG